MLKNYLKIAFRNLIKRKVTSMVNLMGLSIGITLTVLLILYAQYELDYDKFHPEPEQTYRLLRMEELGNNTQIVAKTSPRIMLSLTEEFSEVESTTLLFKHWNVPLLSQEDKGFYEQDFLFADSSFFDVFGYELLLGNPETALSEPNSLVITEQMAKKYFGDKDPIGRVLRYELKYDLEITGVVKALNNVGAHFEFDFLASMPTLPKVMTLDVLTGAYNGFYSYIHFRPGTDVQSFKTRYEEWLVNRFPEERIRIQPLLDIHLRSDAISEIEGQSDIMFVRVVLIIAIVVIILATINYINSAVSTSVERLKEMGVRMVSGAFAQHIYFQFILEAILTIAIAIVISLIALYFMITPFNTMLDTSLILNPIAQWEIWLVIASLILVTAIISGMAPAIVILRMELTDVLLNVVTLGKIGYLRKGLMVFQFVVSVVLIVGAVTINRQAAFVKSKDLGFDQSEVVVVPIRDRGIHTGYESLKDDVLGIAGVTSVSRASTIPGRPYAAKYYKPEPAALDSILMNVGSIDDHYFQSLGIRMLTGTDFEFLKDELTNPVVVNETVIEAFELGDPLEALGKSMYHDGQKFMIIGVIQDFNYETLHKRIQPLVIQPGRALEDFMIVKYQGVNGDAVAKQLSALWYSTAYEQPFTYSSLSDDLASLYQSEKVWGDIGNLSMLVSVLIGALGVFGLVSLVVQKRFKEMGLRKIFGASHGNIIGIIYSEFFTILFITLLISVPSAYLLSQLWLQDFAYRIDVPIDGFVIAMALLASVTCLAVLFHTLRALAKDPINALSD
ncbi:ABC transporter permease [Roseivirga sp. E12]|uniref:ABC transporter permease n=1 Tax=Roseivirga sp. E12 TaxID=2819237 RepID=UPI001ABCA6A1|nr:ABC transporter permease [Roseivirga sp. E12]MBO3698272.1 ABC transporter permease [Roseivirga sp. E12]